MARTSELEKFGDILRPQDAQEPILAKPVRMALGEWLEEIWAEKDLEQVGLLSRKRAIFHGAPGTGKTTLAHHLAGRLGLPLLIIRPERLQSKYVSETGHLIGALFDALHRHADPVFLFFDEFDSLAAKRMNGGSNEGVEQEHNNSINVLLANFDRYKGFIVAATNYGNRIDPALWRRFEIQIELQVPGDGERRRILSRYLSPFVLPDPALHALGVAMASASPALIRQFAEHIKRQIVVGPKADWDMEKLAVFSRLLATVKPHPDLGLPRLWSLGERDSAIDLFPWPLQRQISDYPSPDLPAIASETVVPLRPRKDEAHS